MTATRTTLTLLALVLLALPAGAGRWDVEESRTIRETLSFPTSSDDNVLVVDNINGSIKVTGHAGDEVRVVAHETVRAHSREDFERARREAGLEVDLDGSTLYLVVDGPFRNERGWVNWDRDLGYDLHYDFEIQVPHRTSVELKTVNHGDVEARDVEGEFKVSNVNGAIDMTGIAGHGFVTTVNGAIDVGFTQAPTGECGFKTVNGNIDVGFPSGLDADVRFKTFNGDVYTDFEYTANAATTSRVEKRGQRKVWKSLGSGARIGAGGPEMSFDTLNGNIYIRNTDH